MRFSEVIRPKRFNDVTPKDRQIVLVEGDLERVPELDHPGNPPAVAFAQIYNIRCNLLPSESDPTPIEQYQAVAHAAIVHAITDQEDRWHSFDGLAFNADLGSPVGLDADGGKDGVNIVLVVWYRTSERSPYQVRA